MEILLSAALLLTAYFHIGWRVSVGGRALDGVYRPADVIGSLQGAKLLSGEILGEEAKLDVTLTPAVTRDDYAADIRAL